LHTNPLRILDSKNPQTQAVLDGGPTLEDFLDVEANADFARLCELLQAGGVTYVVNRRLVRGLDYYNKTVFEWVTDRLGAQGTVCAGGRYDGLVEQLGGRATPAIGFAMGMERLVLLLLEQGVAADAPAVDVYVVAVGAEAQCMALVTTERLREEDPQLRIVLHTGGGSFKSQMKKADKSGARVALIWGDDEVAALSVTVKTLRERDGATPGQLTVSLENLETTLCAVLAP
jgi:histidyl-tRNA synthetase